MHEKIYRLCIIIYRMFDVSKETSIQQHVIFVYLFQNFKTGELVSIFQSSAGVDLPIESIECHQRFIVYFSRIRFIFIEIVSQNCCFRSIGPFILITCLSTFGFDKYGCEF